MGAAMGKTLYSLIVLTLLTVAGGSLAPVTLRWGHRTLLKVRARALWGRACSVGLPARNGAPDAWLSIPSCGIEAMVLKGASKANLEKSICMETLSDEGDQKFRILSGHRDTHFRRLRQLGTGSEVTLEHLDGSTTRYRVVDIDSVARDGLARYFANQRNREWIALLTCYPFRFIGPAPERFIAWAAPVAAGVN